ncbi:MAG: hypothetical protein V1901_00705 [Patescibacteria group bacterium]|nr:hypothetical protein [Patescibacteria group bacterium]
MDEQKQPNKINFLHQDNIQPDIKQDLPEIPKKTGLPKWVTTLITVLVIAVIGIGGYFAYNYYFVPDEPEPITYSEDCFWRPNQDLETCQDDQKLAGAYFNGTECLNITSCSTSFEDQQSCQMKCIKEVPEADIQKYNLEVIWNESLELLDIDCQLKYGVSAYETCEYYLAGVIKNGILIGKNLYLEVAHSMGDIFRHYVMINNNNFYFDGYYGDEAIKNWEIKGIDDLPEEIYFSDTDYKLSKYPYGNRLFSKLEDTEKVFHNNELGDFYLYNKCLLAELPDHRTVSYDFILPFISSEDKVLKVTFNNEQKNQDEYLFNAHTGCGAMCSSLDVVDEISQQDLVEIGKTDSNEVFYEFKDPQNKILTDLYNNKNTGAYYNTDGSYKQLEQSKYTYEEYLAFHPLLFWQDPLDRWIKFKNAEFDSMAEMCKPAIYLYPEENTTLNVQVKPNGGFTGTIPEYSSNGWNIEVNPDGIITDLETGKQYDYLYWSGIGLNYPTRSDVGWIVAKEDIKLFLDNKLKILGLNDKEILDFEDYWVRKLNKMSYYHIWFVSQDEFDRIAPLSIGPNTPMSTIRILMNAKGLDEYDHTIKEQELSNIPQRNGFTIVEWGGALIR